MRSISNRFRSHWQNLISNEDTEFGRRVMAAGLRLRYEPSAVHLSSSRGEPSPQKIFPHLVVQQRAVRCSGTRDQSDKHAPLGIPLRLFRTLAGETVGSMLAVKPTRRFGCKVAVWTCAGHMFEFYFQWIRKSRTGTKSQSQHLTTFQSSGESHRMVLSN